MIHFSVIGAMIPPHSMAWTLNGVSWGFGMLSLFDCAAFCSKEKKTHYRQESRRQQNDKGEVTKTRGPIPRLKNRKLCCACLKPKTLLLPIRKTSSLDHPEKENPYGVLFLVTHLTWLIYGAYVGEEQRLSMASQKIM